MAGIFISYRRNDVAGQVGRLFERLAGHYGETFVFMDIESINPGQQFEDVILQRIRDCDVMLVAIGPSWRLRPQPPAAGTGARAEKDYLLLEIEAAIRSKRTLVPLLIDRNEPLESITDLPDAVLQAQAFDLRHNSFDRDVDAFVRGLEQLGVKPPRRASRERIESALAAAGFPYSWLGGISRTLTPIGGAMLLVATLAGTAWVAYGRGHTAGVDEGTRVVTSEYETRRAEEQRAELKIVGVVTDADQQTIEGAAVKLTNQTNQRTTIAETDSKGVFVANLLEIGISNTDFVTVEINKEPFRRHVQNVEYRRDFQLFRNTLRRR